MTVKWNGPEVIKAIEDEMAKRLYRASVEWVRHARQQMGRAATGGGFISGLFTKVAVFAGAYPFKRTGHLRKNVTKDKIDRQNLTVNVGTNVVYGKYLELGTKTMRKRPWMTKTNKAMRRRLIKIFSAKMRGNA